MFHQKPKVIALLFGQNCLIFTTLLLEINVLERSLWSVVCNVGYTVLTEVLLIVMLDSGLWLMCMNEVKGNIYHKNWSECCLSVRMYRILSSDLYSKIM